MSNEALSGPSTNLFGIAFANGTAGDILRRVRRTVSSRPRLVVTANVEHVVTLRDVPAFRTAYGHAVARTLDGMPLVWLAKLRGSRTATRVTGHDLLDAVFANAGTSDDRVFLVCATSEAAFRLTERLRSLDMPADAVASAVPPFGFERDAAASAALAAAVRSHGTTLLLMGVGAPKSEIWAMRQGAALGSPVVLCVGEALNVAAGLVQRAPLLMQRLGFEWLFRFGTAPARLFRRYFVRSWRFLLLAGRDTDLGPTLGRWT